jgi:hypothetical protein
MKPVKQPLKKTSGFGYIDVRYGVDPGTFVRGLRLFTDGAVKNFQHHPGFITSQVQGGDLYRVGITPNSFERADCTCYVGQDDILCKHVVALALEILKKRQIVDDEGNNLNPQFDLNTESGAKAQINTGFRKIIPYVGPSKKWFEYQGKLALGSNLITDTLNSFASNKENIKYLWTLVVKISKKLSHGGVDDPTAR